jgi:hypothetical protein
VDRVGARRARGVEDAIDHEVRLAARRGADRDRLVRFGDVWRVGVGVGVHGDAGEAHRANRS